ncbi:hypothetical protein [Pseudomonas monteilii]|uniref:hypothetical protein n=1 Tax=Pseudomonas monteilii TaxID=76759 RepID=UPI001CBF2429|nr:hypothetical protein [Pseudomonas monteilii]MBZ3661950.1 hypothetical protein [Pseudomonas monteilii]MBZ3667276.1 hypothetical protein [Pseudomonas monteilii]
MSISYKEFLEFAERVVKEADSEFSLRNGVSRGYYGVYHLALGYADSISLPPVSDYAGPTHRKLSQFFEQSMNADMQMRRTLRRLGYSLKQLHDSRVDADYHLNETVTLKTAQDHLTRCALRVKDFNELINAKAA